MPLLVAALLPSQPFLFYFIIISMIRYIIIHFIFLKYHIHTVRTSIITMHSNIQSFAFNVKFTVLIASSHLVQTCSDHYFFDCVLAAFPIARLSTNHEKMVCEGALTIILSLFSFPCISSPNITLVTKAKGEAATESNFDNLLGSWNKPVVDNGTRRWAL